MSKYYLTNCFFYDEHHDMSATIQYCSYDSSTLYEYPCKGCEHFIGTEDAKKIIKEYLQNRGTSDEFGRLERN